MENQPISSSCCSRSSAFYTGLRVLFIALAAIALAGGILGFLKVGVFSTLGNVGAGCACGGAFIFLVIAYFCKKPESKPVSDEPPLVVDKEEKRRFFGALKENRLITVRALIENNPIHRTQMQDADGNTPLHYAAANRPAYSSRGIYYGISETIGCMLTRGGGNINQKNNQGETPVHLAVKNGNFGAIQIFKQHNPDFLVRNNEGLSARDLALVALQQDTCGYLVPDSSGQIDSRIAILKAIHEKHPYKLSDLQSIPRKHRDVITA